MVLDKSLFNTSKSRNSIDYGKKSNQVCYFTNSAIFSNHMLGLNFNASRKIVARTKTIKDKA